MPTQHCTVHLAREAPYRCDRCRRPYCPACLHRVQGGMVCTHCLDELERALDAHSIEGRLHRLPAVLMAAAVLVALLVGGSALVGKLLGPAGSLASTECAGMAVDMAHAGQLAAGAGVTPAVATPAPAASTPQRAAVLRLSGWSARPDSLVLHLDGAGFRPNELVCLSGALSGQGRHGQPRRDTVGPIGVSATATGTIAASLDFGSAPGGYGGRYAASVEAAGVAELRRGESAGVHLAVRGTELTVQATPPA